MSVRGLGLFLALATSILGACATTPEEAPPSDDFILASPSYTTASAAPAFSAATASTLATAAPDGCEDEFLAQARPALLAPAPAGDVVSVCFEHFAVLHSGSHRGPLWSAYRLTKKMSEDGDAFTGARPSYHDETALPASHRSHASDYAHNPWDVGHMTPNNDMPDVSSQRDSFSLANMSPQYETLNRSSWKQVEATVHDLPKTAGDIYIVTGPIFAAHPTLMNGRVAIPTAFFKAVFDPSRNKAIAFVFANRDDAMCELLSLADLERRAGVRPFPTLPKAVRETSGEWTVPEICDDE